MPSVPASIRPAGHDQSAGMYERRDGLTALLRNSHIFASVVRDVLETRVLGNVSSQPLSLNQITLLRFISRNGHRQMGDVARLLGVSAPAATKTVDKLERLGLVKRAPSSTDRRATLLTLTRAGHRLVVAYEALAKERLAPVLDEFTESELAQLAGLLDRLSVGLLEGETSNDHLCLRCSAYYDEQCSIRRLGVACPYAKAALHARRARSA